MSIQITEPLLHQDSTRYAMFPIQDESIWSMYKKQVDCFWRCEEVDTSRDLADWDTLSGDEKHFISMVLAFFAGSDGLVLENLGARFLSDVGLSEAKAFYSFQMMMECVHGEMYSILIDTYIKEKDEKNKLFNAMENFPCIKKKGDWAKKWINDNRSSFATRLVAFAIVEGLFFSSAFASIFWLKKRGLLPGLCTSNDFISRDEGMHVEFAVLLYSKLNKKVNKKRVLEIMKEAVEIEKEFIIDAIPCRLIGMNSKFNVLTH